jgi:hypothetical protein
MEITFEKYSNENNNFHEYFRLFKRAFPKSRHMICKHNKYQEYLQWLYQKNPLGTAIGYNAYSQDRLIGHYACVPCMWTQGDATYKVLLSLNTAIDPAFQRRGIFSTLAKQTYDLAKELEYDFVYGISNGNSTYGFYKLGFEILGPLYLQTAFCRQVVINSDKMTENSLSNALSGEFLNWRLQRPFTRYHKQGARIISNPQNMVVNFASNLMANTAQVQTDGYNFKNPFQIYIGSKAQRGFITVPQWARLAPLNLIFKNLNPNNKIDSSIKYWNLDYLDFDLA